MIIINSQALLNAIEAIDLVPTRAGIIPSEFIQIEKKGKKIYFSLAAEVYGKTYCKAISSDSDDFIFHVDRTSFIPWITASKAFKNPPNYKVEITEKKKTKILTIRAGRRKLVLNAIAFVEGYPTYTASNAVTITLSEKQKALLQLAAKYATPDPTLAYLNCVQMLEKRSVLASARIALFHAPNRSLPVSVPLPLMLLSLIDHANVRSIAVSKSVVRLDLGKGYICQSINSVAKKDFPVKQCTTHFKRSINYPLQFKVNAISFLNALSRLQLYIKNVVSRELIVVIATIKKESKAKLYCDTPQGRFTEVINLVAPAKTDARCEWLLPYLTPLEPYSKTLGAIEVRFDDAKKSPYHFSSKDGIEIILSRRVKV